MRKDSMIIIAAAAILTALASSPAIRADTDNRTRESDAMMRGGQSDMTQGGQTDMIREGQGSMMGMMQQMNEMMATCNNMMQGMAQQHGPEAPKEGSTPEKSG